MGLFASHSDNINDKLAKIDEKELYKKALAAIEVQGDEMFHQLDSTELEAIIIHHDLQEIKEELKKLNN